MSRRCERSSRRKAGRISRRSLTRRVVGLGLTAPFATQLLAHAGLAQSSTPVDYKPTRAGGGGALRTLFWQAPTLLNPHFAVGAKDAEGAGIFYEPLAVWDPNGDLVPVLAAEIPSIENGAVAADGMSVNWRLKRGVQWHDKQPFTADDVVIDDSDGALLFGLGVHGQYLFVNAEKLVVAKGCCPTGCPLDAARITATLRAVSAVRRP